MYRLLAVCALLFVIPLLMGATCTLTQVTPNPGGMPMTADIDGRYTLAPGELILWVEP